MFHLNVRKSYSSETLVKMTVSPLTPSEQERELTLKPLHEGGLKRHNAARKTSGLPADSDWVIFFPASVQNQAAAGIFHNVQRSMGVLNC